MTVKGGTGPACAACKYQRRRCTPDCPLAEYFPHDQPRVFRNAHRLFGVSNILKTLNRVHPDQKHDAMRSIIFESAAWDRYPANGCAAVIFTLRYHIRQVHLELQEVNARLAAYRGLSDAPPPSSLPAGDFLPSMMDNVAGSMHPLIKGTTSDDIAFASLWMQPQYNSNIIDDSMVNAIPQDQDQFLDSGQCSIQQDYDDDISPFFTCDTIDEEIPYESSSDSSEKNTMEPSTVEDNANELKHAAARLTLTSSVN